MKLKMKVYHGINLVVLFTIALSGYIEKGPLKHSCGGVYYVVQGSLVFLFVYKNQKCDHSNESY